MSIFFILSKLLYGLIEPFTWIVLLVIGWYFVRNKKVKRGLGIAAVVIFLLFTNKWIFSRVVRAWDAVPSGFSPSRVYNCGILLGGMSSPSGDTAYFAPSADRFIQTLRLYKQGVIRKILITGGSGMVTNQRFREADFIKQQFIQLGVPGQDVIEERNSKNTYENAIFTRRILDSLNIAPPYVLITSTYHMRRSVAIFRHAGYTAFDPFFADHVEVKDKWTPDDLFLPDPVVLAKWNAIIKEMIGIIVYKLTGKA